MSDLYRKIKELEISLHQPDVRSNAKLLTLLLHANFKEIGYSGVTYDLNGILETFISENTSEKTSEKIYTIWSQNYEFISLSDGIVQVTYLSARENNGTLTHHAKRTPIWVNVSGAWKMQYHQATPTSSFEKECA